MSWKNMKTRHIKVWTILTLPTQTSCPNHMHVHECTCELFPYEVNSMSTGWFHGLNAILLPLWKAVVRIFVLPRPRVKQGAPVRARCQFPVLKTLLACRSAHVKGKSRTLAEVHASDSRSLKLVLHVCKTVSNMTMRPWDSETSKYETSTKRQLSRMPKPHVSGTAMCKSSDSLSRCEHVSSIFILCWLVLCTERLPAICT